MTKIDKISLKDKILKFANDSKLDEGLYDEYKEWCESLGILPQDPGNGFLIVYVNVYEQSQMYGGPEEGGWWYEAGVLMESHPIRVWYDNDSARITDDESKAIGVIENLLESSYKFDTRNRYSCDRRKGPDYCLEIAWNAIEHYPDEKPRYE